MPTSQRAAFLALVLQQMHAPYRWNAKGTRDATTGQRLFDCSGLVTWALREVGGPDWRATHNTDRLWAECRPVDFAELLPGDLVLYHRAGAPEDAEHVMVHVGGGVVVGASGGGRATQTLADAQLHDAKVKAFPHFAYRADVMGFRRLPFMA
ncbi:C40 family peptidase [Pyxidicoccus parkwayensis]|uniref:C40 family peptidase n=1 Tax=Pyxidicoccus parkwayensis TaxID=2813578 RepID=A0ABX7NKC3_9BACT|nr:NlpC/P60 family protein [Pyxidicoccus parkwaysis]QSQ19307.1 C40 family peptidase [Pyxidicoccus parkwaysis]